MLQVRCVVSAGLVREEGVGVQDGFQSCTGSPAAFRMWASWPRWRVICYADTILAKGKRSPKTRDSALRATSASGTRSGV